MGLSLGDAERAHLRRSAAAVGTPLDEAALARFSDYATLLDVWASRTNLISCRTGRELVDRHFVDAIVLATLVRDARVIVDLGSGAGFPGVPLAIVHPDKQVVCVEPRHRRGSFLREVARRVAPNVSVAVRRAELDDGPPIVADVVVSRAVWPDGAIGVVAEPWLAAHGVLLWVRGAGATLTLPADATLRRREAIEYAIAGSHQGRIEILERVCGSSTIESA